MRQPIACLRSSRRFWTPSVLCRGNGFFLTTLFAKKKRICAIFSSLKGAILSSFSGSVVFGDTFSFLFSSIFSVFFSFFSDGFDVVFVVFRGGGRGFTGLGVSISKVSLIGSVKIGPKSLHLAHSKLEKSTFLGESLFLSSVHLKKPHLPLSRTLSLPRGGGGGGSNILSPGAQKKGGGVPRHLKLK